MAKSSPARKPSKIRSVPIADMRIPPALVTQREFRQSHGDRLAADLDLNKLGYPIINHRDGIYWVVDGQHRIYALRENGFGQDVLDCEVYEGLTDQETAEIFLGRDERKPIPLYDKFHVACTAGRRRERDVQRIVEANGQTISRKPGDGITAVGALTDVYDHHGEQVVGQVIRTINVGFGGDTQAFDRAIIEGLGLLYNRYNGKANEKRIGAHLAQLRQGARELLRKAQTIRERTGTSKKHCVAAAIVDLYNKGLAPRASQRLPSWWAEVDR